MRCKILLRCTRAVKRGDSAISRFTKDPRRDSASVSSSSARCVEFHRRNVITDVAECERIYISSEAVSLAVSYSLPRQRNRNARRAARRGVAAIHHSYTQPNLISVSDPPAMMAFEEPLPSPRPAPPRPRHRDRSVYCYVAFMHEPSAILLSRTHDELRGEGREVASEREGEGGWETRFVLSGRKSAVV